MIYNLFAALFVAGCLFVWRYKPVHTGMFGSLGLLAMAVSALWSMDDSLYASVHNIVTCFAVFMVGVSLCMFHVLYWVLRAVRKHPEARAHGAKRSSDFMELK